MNQVGAAPLAAVGITVARVAVNQCDQVDLRRRADRFDHIQGMQHLTGKVVVAAEVKHDRYRGFRCDRGAGMRLNRTQEDQNRDICNAAYQYKEISGII